MDKSNQKKVSTTRKEIINDWFDIVWEALEGFREDCISEGVPSNDRQWEEICSAMACIRKTIEIKEKK